MGTCELRVHVGVCECKRAGQQARRAEMQQKWKQEGRESEEKKECREARKTAKKKVMN